MERTETSNTPRMNINPTIYQMVLAGLFQAGYLAWQFGLVFSILVSSGVVWFMIEMTPITHWWNWSTQSAPWWCQFIGVAFYLPFAILAPYLHKISWLNRERSWIERLSSAIIAIVFNFVALAGSLYLFRF